MPFGDLPFEVVEYILADFVLGRRLEEDLARGSWMFSGLRSVALSHAERLVAIKNFFRLTNDLGTEGKPSKKQPEVPGWSSMIAQFDDVVEPRRFDYFKDVWSTQLLVSIVCRRWREIVDLTRAEEERYLATRIVIPRMEGYRRLAVRRAMKLRRCQSCQSAGLSQPLCTDCRHAIPRIRDCFPEKPWRFCHCGCCDPDGPCTNDLASGWLDGKFSFSDIPSPADALIYLRKTRYGMPMWNSGVIPAGPYNKLQAKAVPETKDSYNGICKCAVIPELSLPLAEPIPRPIPILQGGEPVMLCHTGIGQQWLCFTLATSYNEPVPNDILEKDPEESEKDENGFIWPGRCPNQWGDYQLEHVTFGRFLANCVMNPVTAGFNLSGSNRFLNLIKAHETFRVVHAFLINHWELLIHQLRIFAAASVVEIYSIRAIEYNAKNGAEDFRFLLFELCRILFFMGDPDPTAEEYRRPTSIDDDASSGMGEGEGALLLRLFDPQGGLTIRSDELDETRRDSNKASLLIGERHLASGLLWRILMPIAPRLIPFLRRQGASKVWRKILHRLLTAVGSPARDESTILNAGASPVPLEVNPRSGLSSESLPNWLFASKVTKELITALLESCREAFEFSDFIEGDTTSETLGPIAEVVTTVQNLWVLMAFDLCRRRERCLLEALFGTVKVLMRQIERLLTGVMSTSGTVESVRSLKELGLRLVAVVFQSLNPVEEGRTNPPSAGSPEGVPSEELDESVLELTKGSGKSYFSNLVRFLLFGCPGGCMQRIASSLGSFIQQVEAFYGAVTRYSLEGEGDEPFSEMHSSHHSVSFSGPILRRLLRSSPRQGETDTLLALVDASYAPQGVTTQPLETSKRREFDLKQDEMLNCLLFSAPQPVTSNVGDSNIPISHRQKEMLRNMLTGYRYQHEH
jgi:hypothetical protein